MNYAVTIFLLLFFISTEGVGGKSCYDYLQGSTSIGSHGETHTELKDEDGKVISVCKQMGAGTGIYSPQRYKFKAYFDEDGQPKYSFLRQSCGIGIQALVASIIALGEAVVEIMLGSDFNIDAVNYCYFNSKEFYDPTGIIYGVVSLALRSVGFNCDCIEYGATIKTVCVKYRCNYPEDWRNYRDGNATIFNDDDVYSNVVKSDHYIFKAGDRSRQVCLQQNNDQQVGCVTRLFPAVGPYKVNLIDEPKVIIEKQESRYYAENYESSFVEPVIKLKYDDRSQLLKYRFHGEEEVNNSIPMCAEFGDGRYCAIVPDNDNSKVCACKEKDNCSAGIFVGCVARPSLEESNIALVIDYVADNPSALLESEHEDEKNAVSSVPAIKVSLVRKNKNGFLKRV